MLKIVVPGATLFDERTSELIETRQCELQLEHSLVSISKWESKYHKTFLRQGAERTSEELLYYIKCMTLNKNVDENVYLGLSYENYIDIKNYMDDPMTATKIPKDDKKNRSTSNEPLTSELIYYYMIKLEIPVEFQKWHINRLLTLIDLCGFKDEKPNKMSQKDLLKRNSDIRKANEAKINAMRKMKGV